MADTHVKIDSQYGNWVQQKMLDNETSLGEIKADLAYIKRDIKEIKDTLRADYITKDEFAPIKSIVYGMVAIILTGVIGALVALVIKQ